MKKYIITFLFIILACSLQASEFEELDKAPEGPHQGQMLLGVFVSMGWPMGSLLDAEDSFLVNNFYSFEDIEVTKELIVNHLAYDFGISYEYMPIDYVGARCKLRNATIVQRTAFGSNYQNWSGDLFSQYSFLLGPSFHLSNRKQWDINLILLLGYGFGEYEAAPIFNDLVEKIDGKRDQSGMVYAAELNLTVYFSGGLYLSLGGEYTYYSISFSPAYSITQTVQTANTYSAESGGSLQSVNISISAGYAFSN